MLAFIAILASLASALFFMMRNGRDDKSKGNHGQGAGGACGLSIVLFLCILGGLAAGIHPAHRAARHPLTQGLDTPTGEPAPITGYC